MDDLPAFSEDDIVIVVMGATGSGKTTFISTLVGEDVGIGHGLKSKTSTTAAYSFTHQPSGRRVHLIDTPGFNDTALLDSEVLRDIAFALTQLYRTGVRLTGIVHLHPITGVRISGPSKKMMQLIAQVCGAEALPYVVLVSSMWEKLGPTPANNERAIQHEAELMFTEEFWGAMYRGEAKVARWDRTREVAISMIEHLMRVRGKLGTVTLQIQREMMDQGMDLSDTSAGKAVNSKLHEKKAEYQEEMKELDLEFEKAKQSREEAQASDLAMLRAENEKRISETEKALEDLRVNFDRLSQQKREECDNLLEEVSNELERVMKEREEKELEDAQSDDDDEVVVDEHRFPTELKYNEARLQELDNEIRKLSVKGQTEELEKAVNERRRVQQLYKQFAGHKAKKDRRRRRKEELSSLQGTESKLGKWRSALQAFGVLAGVGLIAAGGATGIAPLIPGGIAMITTSINSMRRGGRGNKDDDDDD